MLFNGVFNELTPSQCCALLSVFVFQEKASEMPKLTDELSGPLRIMQVQPRYSAVVWVHDIGATVVWVHDIEMCYKGGALYSECCSICDQELTCRSVCVIRTHI